MPVIAVLSVKGKIPDLEPWMYQKFHINYAHSCLAYIWHLINDCFFLALMLFLVICRKIISNW